MKKTMFKAVARKELGIKNYMPFFQLDHETASIDDFLTVGNGCILFDIVDFPKEKAIKHIRNVIKGHEKEVLSYLKDTLIIIQKMIYIATVDHEISEEELQTFNEKSIEPMLERCSYWSHWQRPSRAFIMPMQDTALAHDTWEEMFKGLRCWFIWAIIESFSSQDGMPSRCSDRISACPTCLQIFEKKRKDQVFCCRKCQNTGIQRRNRAKKRLSGI